MLRADGNNGLAHPGVLSGVLHQLGFLRHTVHPHVDRLEGEREARRDLVLKCVQRDEISQIEGGDFVGNLDDPAGVLGSLQFPVMVANLAATDAFNRVPDYVEVGDPGEKICFCRYL